MSTKLTEAKLRQMVREEFTRSQGGEETRLVMTEARAKRAADEVLEEGLFDTIKAGFAALTAGSGEAASKLGAQSGKAFKPAIDMMARMTQAAKDTKTNISKGIAAIKDEALKKAVVAARNSFKTSLTAVMKKEISNGLANIVKTGLGEEEAKGIIATVAFEAMTAVVGEAAAKKATTAVRRKATADKKKAAATGAAPTGDASAKK